MLLVVLAGVKRWLLVAFDAPAVRTGISGLSH